MDIPNETEKCQGNEKEKCECRKRERMMCLGSMVDEYRRKFMLESGRVKENNYISRLKRRIMQMVIVNIGDG